MSIDVTLNIGVCVCIALRRPKANDILIRAVINLVQFVVFAIWITSIDLLLNFPWLHCESLRWLPIEILDSLDFYRFSMTNARTMACLVGNSNSWQFLYWRLCRVTSTNFIDFLSSLSLLIFRQVSICGSMHHQVRKDRRKLSTGGMREIWMRKTRRILNV